MTVILVENGQVLTGETFLPAVRLAVDSGRIAALSAPAADDAPPDHRIDLGGGWLLPGFIDTQVNGGGGTLFNEEPTIAGIATIAQAHARFGTTAFLPTLITDTVEAIARAIDAVAGAIAAGVPGVMGIHMEGPFINPARKGIHAQSKIRKLDTAIVDLLCRPRGFPVMLTLAPELASPDDIARLARAGVILSAGHSDATFEQASAAFDLGVRGVTHLFNAMPPLNHRTPGLAGAAMDDDRVWCGLIADGLHVAPSVIRLAVKAKGPERIMLVTDAMPPVGTGNGWFMLDGRRITVLDNRCTDQAGTLAGSNLDMASAVRNIIEYTGVDIASASRMASGSPAAFLGMAEERGTLAPDRHADFIVLGSDMQVAETWIGGRRIWAKQ